MNRKDKYLYIDYAGDMNIYQYLGIELGLVAEFRLGGWGLHFINLHGPFSQLAGVKFDGTYFGLLQIWQKSEGNSDLVQNKNSSLLTYKARAQNISSH